MTTPLQLIQRYKGLGEMDPEHSNYGGFQRTAFFWKVTIDALLSDRASSDSYGQLPG